MDENKFKELLEILETEYKNVYDNLPDEYKSDMDFRTAQFLTFAGGMKDMLYTFWNWHFSKEIDTLISKTIVKIDFLVKPYFSGD